MKEFYTVIVIKLDIFESEIIDERHFGTENEANQFANKYDNGYKTVIAPL